MARYGYNAAASDARATHVVAVCPVTPLTSYATGYMFDDTMPFSSAFFAERAAA